MRGGFPLVKTAEQDGSLAFEGRLSAEVGAMLVQGLDRATEWLMRGERIEDVPLPLPF